jgi:hypothetical protein
VDTTRRRDVAQWSGSGAGRVSDRSSVGRWGVRLMPRGGSRIGSGRRRKDETLEQRRARLGIEKAKRAAKASKVGPKPEVEATPPATPEPPPGSGAVLPEADDLDADLSPLDFLKAVQRNKKLPLETRMRAAMAAAPYTHAKLRDAGMGLKDERKKKAAAVTQGSSRFSPGAPPLSVVPGGKTSS